MINFKQKEFSSLTTKTIHGVKRTINAARKGSKKKTPMQLKRSAVETKRKIKGLSGKIKYAADEAVTFPGEIIGEKVLRPTIEAPLSGAASKVAPFPGATALQITKLAPLEKKYLQTPRVTRTLEKVGKMVSDKTKPVINAAGDIIRNNPGTFIPGL